MTIKTKRRRYAQEQRARVTKGQPNGRVIHREEYVDSHGVRRVKMLHATKGWRDQRAA